jgi:heterodisulfide reductase subunit A
LAACSCCSSDQICYSCTQPRIRCKENLFQKNLLDQHLFEFVNIREQCAWIHQNDKNRAAAKAKDLIKMAVSRAQSLEAPPKEEVKIEKKVLIIGGGPAGMQCAIDLAEQGFPITLIEKESQLGGRLNRLNTLSFTSQKPKEFVGQIVGRLQKLPVKVMTQTEVKGIEGGLGNFAVSLRRGDKTTKLTVGAIVLALGTDIYKPNGEYSYGSLPNVITNSDLVEKLPEITADKTKKAVFIQCVGSNGYTDKRGCSKYCCETALHQALRLKEKGIDAAILFQELYLNNAKAQELLKQAQAAGISFIPYGGTKAPQIISKGNSLKIKLEDQKEQSISADMVILSVGMVAREDSRGLANLLRLPQGQDGFFKEKDPLLGLVETQVPGVFLAGSCQRPKGIIDSMIHGSAVASKAGILLAKEKIYLDSMINRVDEVKCRACGTCVAVCGFGAPRLGLNDQGKPVAKIDPVLCQSCGTCAAHCPSGAITAPCFTDKQINSMLESLLAS